jgi:hypothetical protein
MSHKNADHHNRTAAEPAPKMSLRSSVLLNLVATDAYHVIEQERTHAGNEQANEELREVLEWGNVLDLLMSVQPNAAPSFPCLQVFAKQLVSHSL